MRYALQPVARMEGPEKNIKRIRTQSLRFKRNNDETLMKKSEKQEFK